MGKQKRFETEVIHSGYDSLQHQGSLVPPLFQTSTFTFPSAAEGERRFAGESEGYVYSRLGNPTVKVLEERMAALEKGEVALAFGSGMAAVSATLFYLTKTGDHILCSEGIYGCTFGLLQLMKKKHQIQHDLIHFADEETVRAAIRDNTTCIYIETPINPTMKLVDLEMVSRVAKEKGIPVVVDNTFCSPYLQQPLTLGCDYVIHSATKYIGGHGDVIAGIVVGRKEEMGEMAMTTLKDIGGIISPFDAWLLIRGLKTLPVRLDRHCENAKKIAVQLKKHPKVKTMYFPGDPDFPQYELANRQMKHPGGMISFEIDGTKEEAQAFLNHCQLIKIAVSLGDSESLIQHPATMTHAVVPEEERLKMGITDQLIRLSVGLEAWEDIWEDLQQALDRL
ncbi:methionine gamma-lyase [Heyndrickxia sporothermodurans]|uniref:L-methionine gamma-lyase n=1 Tax=Heyndrickxia sporothermodurans TaxID=46224 RepID=A0A150KMG7_9BACI|nr:methionine gamma-lyase [Heyndrickxia sporothermodurans]KYC94343.1 Methionine gamma-lyase [Heyndrickxia sporothermodurans]MBL5768963.1 methionine gamma-lyase [Heyndrickxia sporothermodurans]MBL5770256.1 methionine gamma-lyase [Heyndrickxia sporothermodurans]MBL5775219.1 methionine gamma-lyase [Heyndrickxia sporothermodurans]MBL5779782.1 methionine gamma-lyase [Heyndrickxia sporothermodurans]